MVRSLARARLAALAALSALAGAACGCAAFGPPEGFAVSPARWNERVAHRGIDPAEVPNPMAVNPAMQKAARELAGAGSDEERLARLRVALLDGRRFTFEYEKTGTFTASEAFESHRGNCVSFTNLFIALGRSLGIRLRAALVSERGESEKAGDFIVTYNHMVAVHPLAGASVRVYDFFLLGDQPAGRIELLDDLSVAAVRISNQGVAHLAKGEVADARALLERAVTLGPGVGSLYANLGLARWRSGDVDGAFVAFRKGLEIEPHSPSILQNLAALYVAQDRPAEARAALAALDERRASAYALIVRGDLLLVKGDAAGAIRNYRDAARADPKLARPWLGIARAEIARQRPKAARKAVAEALKREPENTEALALAEAMR